MSSSKDQQESINQVESKDKQNNSQRVSFENLESLSPSKPPQDLPRLVTRNYAFHQSKNRMHVMHNKGWAIFSLLRHDWFHVFLRQPTWASVPFLIAIWTAMIIIFAAIYVGVDQRDPGVNCGLGDQDNPIGFGPAFAFSLETCTTVGYGLPNGVNSFFESKCAGLQTVIYFQMVWSMMFNAFLFAFFYNRVGRCEARGVQVVFSAGAIVNISLSGQVRFQFRVFDVDARHPVVEAHVRIYVVDRHHPVPRLLRTLQPNDELGGMLFLSLPMVVSHNIDIYSGLHPPVELPLKNSGLDLRQVDSATAGREEVVCPICAESYGTHERWLKHVQFQKIVEEKDDYPTENTHLSLTEADLQPPTYPIKNIGELKQHFKEEISEIICVIEGIDPLMSGTFQALQSYRFEDIVWDENAFYVPCLQVKDKDISIDLDSFHEVEILSKSTKQLAKSQLQSLRTHDSLCSCE